MKEKLEFINWLSSKTNFSQNELKQKVESVFQSLSDRLKTEGTLYVEPKKVTTEVIKKYDVVYLQTMGTIHYLLVHTVKDDKVLGLVITSKEKHSMHTIEKDRFFIGSFFTSSYLEYELEEVKSKFVRVYENKEEADLVFRKAKEKYKKLLNL